MNQNVISDMQDESIHRYAIYTLRIRKYELRSNVGQAEDIWWKNKIFTYISSKENKTLSKVNNI